MSTILIVNGRIDWRPYFIGHTVIQTYLSRSQWLWVDGQLWIKDAQGTHRPDVVLWRLGAVEPSPMHRACLEMLRIANVPCVNAPDTLLRGYDRLSMLFEMRQAGLPLIDFDCATGSQSLAQIAPRGPAVIKVGNQHGGDGKARTLRTEHFQEMTAVIPLTHDYATVEPFIDYQRDVRCLAVGDQIWAMTRRSDTWRANVQTTDYALIDPPEALVHWTRTAMKHLNADVLGLDYLERPSGDWVLLESNDIPGVLGFPDAVKVAMARCLIEKLVG